MRRMGWALVIVAASSGVVTLLIGAGDWIDGNGGSSSRATQVRAGSMPTPAPRADVPSTTPTTQAPLAVADGQGAIRDVTPATVTPPPIVSGPLTRVEPPAALAPPPEPWRPVVFRRATIGSDLSLSAHPPGRSRAARPVTIHLADIAAHDNAAVCRDVLGDAGPCRSVAAAALRALIGARGIECLSPRQSIPSPLITTCRLGPRDLGAWLIGRGYARANSPAGAVAPALPDTDARADPIQPAPAQAPTFPGN